MSTSKKIIPKVPSYEGGLSKDRSNEINPEDCMQQFYGRLPSNELGNMRAALCTKNPNDYSITLCSNENDVIVGRIGSDGCSDS